MNPVRRVPGSKEAAFRPLAQTVSVIADLFGN